MTLVKGTLAELSSGDMLRVMNFLIIEDDELTRLALMRHLGPFGTVSSFDSFSDFKASIRPDDLFDFLFLDLDLEERGLGLQVLRDFSSNFKYKVVLSGREESHIIQEAYQLGANDFLSKPFGHKEVQWLLNQTKINQNVLKTKIKNELFYSNSERIESLSEKLNQLSRTGSLLLTGETGTGKTSFAKFVHKNLLQGPFVHINCAEIPENLVESELFGHRRGAFTGAISDFTGKLCLADGGVLFLDEITTLSVSTQRKLLAAIEEKSFFPVGSKQKVSSDFFLISATCDNLPELIENYEFRPDLYYRINGTEIHLSKLSERKEDLELLIHQFEKDGRRIVFSEEAWIILKEYEYPGNIRELKNILIRLKSKIGGMIEASDIQQLLSIKKSKSTFRGPLAYVDYQAQIGRHGLNDFIKATERKILRDCLEHNNNHVRKTIADLKISKSSFYRILNG